MATKIVTKNSSTASAVPTASDLVQGELAVNVADKRLFTEDNGGAIVELGTNPSALTVTGEITANGGIALGDNDKATFGDGDDLQIYHDGSNSYVADVGTGRLFLSSDGDGINLVTNTGENLIRTDNDGQVRIYHNDIERIRTNSTGIEVTGTATMDGLTVDGNASSIVFTGTTGSNSISAKQGFEIDIDSDSNQGGVDFTVTHDGGTKNLLNVDESGDISFYEDTGTTAKLFWDASAERLVIGDNTVSPSGDAGDLVVGGSTGSNGITIGSATTGTGSLRFADTGGTGRGIVLYDHSSDFMNFHIAGIERMRIDSSGRVGIGCTPTSPLHIKSATNVNVRFDDSGSSSHTWYMNDAQNLYIPNVQLASTHTFYANGQRKVDIDTSGNLLVGTTATTINTSSSVSGHNLFSSGYTVHSRSGQTVMSLNRLSTDGTIVDFRKNGTAVGSIGSGVGDSSASTLYIADAGNVGIRFDQASTDDIQPCNSSGADRDNAINLGASDNRFKDLYLSGAANVGSEVVLADSGTAKFAIGNSGNDFYIYSNAAGSERMRIDSSGNLLVGDTAVASGSNSTCTIARGGTVSISRAATNAQNQMLFYNPNGGVGSIRTNGSTTAFNTTSDQRLKENIADADDAGSKVDAIQVRQYDWKADGSHQDYGMIAQELLEVAPEAVSQGETEEEMMGVDYSKLVPMLIKEIQSLRNRVAQLEE